jgi:phosphoribosyl 1,2-cyclic phosphate phosphodiesterase
VKVTILGCGGAAGVPGIANGWGRCDPDNPRNRRRRSSILVEEGETRILVDTTPDLRLQLLDAGVRVVDAVVYTHEHADHLHGIDDLREINRVTKDWLPIWAAPHVLDAIRRRFDYMFKEENRPGPIVWAPLLKPFEINGPFQIKDVPVVPFVQDHGYTTSLGLRFGDFAYSTDVVNLDEAAFAALEGVHTWVVGCLAHDPHPTHAHVAKVIEWIARVRPRRTILTHLGSYVDYATLAGLLPDGAVPAHDGLVIEI